MRLFCGDSSFEDWYLLIENEIIIFQPRCLFAPTGKYNWEWEELPLSKGDTEIDFY